MKKGIYIVFAIIAVLSNLITAFYFIGAFAKPIGGGPIWNGILITTFISLIGIILSVLSLFSINGLGEDIYSKKRNIAFLILNIIIIIITILFYFAFFRPIGGGIDHETIGAVNNLFS
jgi:hypothetical protein